MNEIETETDKVLGATVQVNLEGATVSLGNDTDSESSDSDEHTDVQLPNSIIPSNTNLNVENSSDVVVGTVTQFHGPVTIYQNTHNNQIQSEPQSSLSHFSNDDSSLSTNTNSVAHLVTTDALPKKQIPNLQEFSISKKRKIVYALTAITTILLICVIIGVIVTRIFDNKVTDLPEIKENQNEITSSKHLLINRARWGGRPPLYIRPMKTPVKYVIIAHTAGAWCDTVITCSIQMQQIQNLHVSTVGSPDIGYNFVIGGDGNIYVARGWDAHNFFLNLDTIGICFIGNFIYDTLTPGMIEAAHQLLKHGVEYGKLTKDFKIYAHNQTYNTQSPGINIYNQIKFWPNFTPETLVDKDD